MLKFPRHALCRHCLARVAEPAMAYRIVTTGRASNDDERPVLYLRSRSDGSVGGVMCMIVDNSAQVSAEPKLAARADAPRRVPDAVPVPIVYVDRNHIHRCAKAVYRDRFDVDPQTMIRARELRRQTLLGFRLAHRTFIPPNAKTRLDHERTGWTSVINSLSRLCELPMERL